MADWHILTRGPAGYRAIFHIPIPATTNPVGVSYRTALVRSGIGGSNLSGQPCKCIESGCFAA